MFSGDVLNSIFRLESPRRLRAKGTVGIGSRIVFSNDVLNSVFRLVCLAVLKVHHLRSFSVLSGSLNCSWLGFCGMFSGNVLNSVFRLVYFAVIKVHYLRFFFPCFWFLWYVQ